MHLKHEKQELRGLHWYKFPGKKVKKLRRVDFDGAYKWI